MHLHESPPADSTADVVVIESGLLDSIVRRVAARAGLDDAAAKDLASMARLKLIEDGGRVLRQRQASSSLDAYLRVIVSRIAVDEGSRRLGRWRPSASAREAGPAAVELETLIARDGLDRASAISRTLQRFPDVGREAVERFLQSLPFRPPRRFVAEDEVAQAEGGSDPEAIAIRNESERLARNAKAALRAAVQGLSERDQLILKLRFEQSMKIVEIARLLGIEQRMLYRRIGTVLAELREELGRRGLSHETVRALLPGMEEN